MIGPNLANVGARSYIAAGWLKNTDENLARWIQNPQAVKKGVLMPNLGVTRRGGQVAGRLPPRSPITGPYGNLRTRPARRTPRDTPRRPGLWSWITTVDHKRIGILYGPTAFFFFLIGGLEALLHPASSW